MHGGDPRGKWEYAPAPGAKKRLTADIFVIPPWSWHSHENRRDEDTILFSMNDWPALKALGLYREELKG